MVDEQFDTGTKVWAKVKGHPWWPAQVADLDDLSQLVLSQKPKRPSYYIPVLFYGSNNYGWLQTDAIRLFDDPSVEVPRKTASLLDAIQRAREDESPDGKLKVFEDDGDSEDGENDSEEEEENVEMGDEEDDVDENPVKASAKKPKTTRKTPSKTPASERKSKNGKRKAETDETPSKRKRREKSEQEDEEDAEEPETYKKKAGKPKTPSKASKKEKQAEEQVSEEPEKKKEKTRSDHAQLMYFRHKVQKMMKEAPETLAASSKIDGIMTEVESFPMTLNLLKDTKMGKLMKRMSQIKFTEDPYGIKERTHRLMKRWKNDFAENLDKDAGSEDTEPKKTADEISSIEKDEKENHRESPANDPMSSKMKEVSSTLEDNVKKSLDEPSGIRSPVKESNAKQEPVVVSGEEKGLAEKTGSHTEENRDHPSAEILNE